MSIFLDQNSGDGARFRGVGNGDGFGGYGGFARGERSIVTTQLLDFGPHLSDVRVDELSAVSCEAREDAENGILGSFPGGPSVRFGVSITVDGFIPRENDVWLSFLLQLPCSRSADVEVWSKVALVFGTDNSQVGVEIGQGVSYVRSNVCVVEGNDIVVPFGENVRRELGDRCGGNRLEGMMDADGVRLDLAHIWLDCRIRERALDERIRVWFQDGVTCGGNGVTN